MHGGINLESELGQGTTTTFWIPFNKPRSTKPLEDARMVVGRLRSNMTIPQCVSGSQSAIGDLQNVATPVRLNSGTGHGLGPVHPEEGPNEDSIQQELDRKTIHVLVVEDK